MANYIGSRSNLHLARMLKMLFVQKRLSRRLRGAKLCEATCRLTALAETIQNYDPKNICYSIVQLVLSA